MSTVAFRDFTKIANVDAVGDGVADDTEAIQDAVNWSIYTDNARVYLPAGTYKIIDTIHLGYGTSFKSVVFSGAGYKYNGRNSSAHNGTAIIAEFSDRPAFAIQGARGSVLKNVGIFGSLEEYYKTNFLGSVDTLLDDTDPDNWIDPNAAATQDSRYAPYAGIAIDPYSGDRPATSYPDVNYPAFLGEVSQYNKNFSSDVLIENCEIRGFNVAIVNQPCDADGNGDFTQLRRINAQSNKYFLSVGNTQSRNVGLYDCKTSRNYAVLTNNKHGKQKGRFAGTISNLSCGSIINLFKFGSSSSFGPLIFIHPYFEAAWRLGDYTATVDSETSLKFKGGYFSFGGQTLAKRGVPSTVLSGKQQPVHVSFEDCFFTRYPSVLMFDEFPDNIKHDNGTFRSELGKSSISNQYQRLAHNATNGGCVVANLVNAEYNNSVKYQRHSIDNTDQLGAYKIIEGHYKSERNNPIPLLANSGGSVRYLDKNTIGNRRFKVGKGTLASFSVTDKTATIEFSGRAEWKFLTQGPDVGDVIWDDQSKSVFWVSSRSGLIVTAELQNNYHEDADGNILHRETISTTNGVLCFAPSRVFSPREPLFGDITSGSNTITNAQRDDGDSSFLHDEIEVGDALLVDEYRDNFISQADAIVTAVDSTAKTITLSGNATRTETRKRLPFWLRKA